MARKAQITIYTALKDQGFKKAEKGLKNLRFQANGLNSSLAKLGLGVGVAQFARTSVRAAVEMEQANSRLAVSLTNIGKASMVGSASIRTSEKAMMSLGFEGTQTALALSTLVTATGSLEKSQGMLAASADLARFKNIDLASASKILAKASGGNAKAFKELGITMDKSLPPAEALEKAMGMLNAKIGGQAAAYATTYSGKLAILEAKFQDVQEQVGYKLLPVLVKLGDFLINTGIPKLEQFFTLMSTHKGSVMGMAAALTTVALAFKAIATYATLAKVAALPIMGAAAPFVAAVAGVTALGVGAQPQLRENQKVLDKANLGYDPVTGQYRDKATGKNITQAEADKKFNKASRGGFQGSPIPGMNKGKQATEIDLQALQAAKDLANTSKATLALAKKEAAKKLMDQRKIDAEKKLSAQFDLNQIALANALKLDLTAKEKAAVEGLLALEEDGYKTEEQRMFAQEAALRKLISLKGEYAALSWDKAATLNGGEKQISIPQTAAASVAGAVQSMGTNTMVTSMPGLAEAEAAATKAMAGGGTTAPAPIVVNINAPMVTPEVVDQISVGLQNKLRAGGVWYSNAASG